MFSFLPKRVQISEILWCFRLSKSCLKATLSKRKKVGMLASPPDCDFKKIIIIYFTERGTVRGEHSRGSGRRRKQASRQARTLRAGPELKANA